jgi:ferredoxin
MAKLEHNREDCIGCGACVAIHPQGWNMCDDGKSDIIKGTARTDGWSEKEVEGSDEQQHLEAARCCPVNVIHLTTNGKKII